MRIETLVRPATLEDAHRLVTTDKTAVPFAGGVWIRLTMKDVKTAVLLDGLGLEAIVVKDGVVSIGALATLSAAADHPVLGTLYDGMFAAACRSVMGVGVQNLVTVGGTVAGGYPFSDILTALLAMDAVVRFHHHEPMKLAAYLERKQNFRDLLVAVDVPVRNGRGRFDRIARTALDFAVLNLAVTNVNGLYQISVGARPGVARLAVGAADRLNALRPVTVFDLERAVADTLAELPFGSNHRASEDYRRALAAVHLGRVLKEVTADAGRL